MIPLQLQSLDGHGGFYLFFLIELWHNLDFKPQISSCEAKVTGGSWYKRSRLSCFIKMTC